MVLFLLELSTLCSEMYISSLFYNVKIVSYLSLFYLKHGILQYSESICKNIVDKVVQDSIIGK